MADRIIKSDSGNDVILQNNGGTRKIEVTNSGDVEVTGDLKATNVKATNLKANDGTAAIGISDSSGVVSLSNGINGIRTNQNVNSSEITLTSSYQDIVTTTITPKSSSSKLLVLAVISVYTSSSGSNIRARIKLTATGHTTTYSDQQEFIGYQGSSDTLLMVNVPINYIFTVSNTNTYTLTLEGFVQSGAGKANYDDGNGDQKSTLQVIEI